MMKKILLFAVCIFAVVLGADLCSSVAGQEKQKNQKKQGGTTDTIGPNSPLRRPVDSSLILSTLMPFGMTGGNAVSLPAEINFDKLTVKSAPFSADLITDIVQLLPNGNKVTRQTVINLHRDKEGRTRIEHTKVPPTSMVDNLAMYKIIVISDPVSKQTFNLQPSSRTAYKTPRIDLTPRRRAAARSATSGTNTNSKNATGQGSVGGANTSQEKPVNTPPPQNSPANDTGAQKSENRKESLGVEVIEGIEAEGTRTVQTIPAGVAGNKGPIEIIDEKWFSPALKMFILIKHSETGKGETTHRLTNIFRSEPDSSLFRVPSDYTIREQPKPGANSRSNETRKKNEK
jgi:hypothetical protein